MRILLAEDDEILRKALVKILSHNNFSIDAVDNGLDALEYINTIDYDLCILDIMMPGLDGLEVIKRVREKQLDVPILILSAKGDPNDKAHGLDIGSDDYLSKPFNSTELISRIKALLRRARSYTKTDVTLGNTTLISASFSVKANNEIRLQNKEYQLLEIMMKSPSRVISIDYIMENIWGLDSDTEMNVVWVYISNLRKKLSQIGSNLTIKSSRNLGYYVTTE